MHPEFKRALDEKLLEVAVLPDGSEFTRLDPVTNETLTFYWASENGINLYAGRFHALSDTIRAHDALKLSPDVLNTAFAALKDLCHTAILSITSEPKKAADCIAQIKTLIDRLDARRTAGMDIEQIYDVATAWFFLPDENPVFLEPAAIARKKRVFTTYPELYTFFLAMRFARFVPFYLLLEHNTLSYLLAQNQEEILDFTTIERRFKTLGISNATSSIISSRLETLKNFNGLLELLSSLTTTTSTLGQPSENEKPIDSPPGQPIPAAEPVQIEYIDDVENQTTEPDTPAVKK